MNTLFDIDDLCDAAIRNLNHQFRGLIGRHLALFSEEFDGLRLGLIPRLVEILIEPNRDPRFRRLDAGKIERPAFDHFNRNIELLVRGFECGDPSLQVWARLSTVGRRLRPVGLHMPPVVYALDPEEPSS